MTETFILMVMRNIVAGVTLQELDKIRCGGMSQRFADAVQSFAATRFVNFLDMGPPMETHVAVEVFYDNDWHYFDPTFGVFFGLPVPSLQGILLSEPAMFRVTKDIWSFRYMTGFLDIDPVPENWLSDRYFIGLPDLYRSMLKKSRICDASLNPLELRRAR